METQFIKGMIVTATMSAQGLEEGSNYKVVNVEVDRKPWGHFVTYHLDRVSCYEPTHVVTNGALFLKVQE